MAAHRKPARGDVSKTQASIDKRYLEYVAKNATSSAPILRKLRASIRAVMRGKTYTTEEAKGIVAARLDKKRA